MSRQAPNPTQMPEGEYPATYRGLTRYVADRFGMGERPARAVVDVAVDFILATVLDNEIAISIQRLGTFYPRYPPGKGKVTLRFQRSWRYGEKPIEGPPPENAWRPFSRHVKNLTLVRVKR